MHALRYSFLSHVATAMDVPTTTLAEIAGHANLAITMRQYARDGRDQERVNEDVLARAAAFRVRRLTGTLTQTLT